MARLLKLLIAALDSRTLRVASMRTVDHRRSAIKKTPRIYRSASIRRVRGVTWMKDYASLSLQSASASSSAMTTTLG